MRSFLLTLLAIVVAFAAFAASELRSGVWTAELDIDGLNVTIFQGRHRQGPGFGNMMSLTVQVPKLTGLSTDAVSGNGADVKFALVRAAGVISFDGHFANGKGAGHFDFTPDPSFLREMEQLGYAGFRDDELLLYAAEDLSPSSLRELKTMGYDISRRDLDDVAVFNITPARVKEYASLGYPNLTLREIVDLRVGNVDATYIQSMRDLGFEKMSARKLADMAIQGVSPKYVREMRAAVPSISPDALMNLRIANITPARIDAYAKAGYPKLSIAELSDFGLQNVTPQYIEDLRKLGYDKLTPQQLIDLRIFNVTPEYIRKMQSIGVTDVQKLLDLRQTGAAEVLLKKK
ncbi:MAG: hypothetical protein ACXV7D_01335 [Thermoanaerobaculia bacterium]